MANYKSNYTGAEIDSAVNKANSIPIIPQPTSENVGKVLGVVEGKDNSKYSLVEMSGGSEDFVVTFSGKTASGNAVCDKTLSEITEAYSRGANIKAVYSYISQNGDTEIFNLSTNLAIHENVCVKLQGWYLTASTDNGTIAYIISCGNLNGIIMIKHNLNW